ncbi:predicted protein [Lichtheimia corymbifera JMRC:FSU:9682]|uniref:Uncharacterized protein n=1 Tax=Lichtheimia corymbifera JMRC:FSU:9682 TaxID=1263082 RepID=A0A068RYX0_9FUNG|nr:predicted protein [Lichtheimia corymbifera JMRC:FSU:9682]
MMNLKLSLTITLALFALTVLSQQDPKTAQEGATNTASPAAGAPRPKLTLKRCIQICRSHTKPSYCLKSCGSGRRSVNPSPAGG